MMFDILKSLIFELTTKYSNKRTNQIFYDFKKLYAISGLSKKKLEIKLWPNGEESIEGFLGEYDDLEETIISDLKILNKFNVTYQILGMKLKKIINLTIESKTKNIRFNGYDFEFKIINTVGFQADPFSKRKKPTKKSKIYVPSRMLEYGYMNIIIKRLDLNKTLKMAGGLPDLIQQYGFFEGKDSPYRIDPLTLLNFFNITTNLISDSLKNKSYFKS